MPVTFDWEDFVILAKKLSEEAENSDIEDAYLRSSISRGYFAVFCLARNHLRDVEGLKIPTKETHKWVKNHFTGTNTKLKIKVQLERLRDDRNKADYNDEVKGLKKMAEKVLIIMNSALEDLERI